jgi:hypothetical protein
MQAREWSVVTAACHEQEHESMRGRAMAFSRRPEKGVQPPEPRECPKRKPIAKCHSPESRIESGKFGTLPTLKLGLEHLDDNAMIPT